MADSSDAGLPELGGACGGWTERNSTAWVVEVVLAVSDTMAKAVPGSEESAWTRVRRAFEREAPNLGPLHALGVMGYTVDADCPRVETLLPMAPLTATHRDDFLVALSSIEPVAEAPLANVLDTALEQLYEANLGERYDGAHRVLLLITDDVGAAPAACGVAEAPDLSAEVEQLWADPEATQRPFLVVLGIPSDPDAEARLSAWRPPIAGEIANCAELDRCESASATASVEEALQYWLSLVTLGSPDFGCSFDATRELDGAELSAIEVQLTPYESSSTSIVAAPTQDCASDDLGWTFDGQVVTLCPGLCDEITTTLRSPGATVSVTYACAE